MIQITNQVRVLVAIESVDGRKGIDSLAQLCQEKLAEDPFSAACSCSGAAAEPQSGYSAMTAKATGWRRSGFPRDVSCRGPRPTEPPNR